MRLPIRRYRWTAAVLAIGVALAAMARFAVEAHTVVTSKYKYDAEVYPILHDRCGGCHVAGGATPMSLVSYPDAAPWAESIREKLVGEAMPPWYADASGPAVKGANGLTTRELDILTTWATGGTPRSNETTFVGVGATNAGATTFSVLQPNVARWKSGPPDLALAMESDCALPVGITERICDLTLSTGLITDKWVKAVDLLPGTPAMVRDAVISLENGPLLVPWIPGDDVVPAPGGTAFHLPAGARLHLRIHYKKGWQYEGEAMSDRSSVGLYFTEPPPQGGELQAWSVTGTQASADPLSPRTFTRTLDTSVRVFAIRPSLDHAYMNVTVSAVLPAGRRVELLRLRAPQPQWYRRYWLVDPIDLPKNSTIEVTALPTTEEPLIPPPLTPAPLEIALDFVPR